MTNEPLYFQSIAAVAQAMRERTLSPVELTRAYLQRIDALDVTLASYITVTAERASADAQAAEAAITRGNYRGPLHGVPIGLKDLIDTAGITTTWGTGWRRGVAATSDALVAARLADAGAVLLGKHALLEFAMGGVDHNPHFGHTRNPWSLEHFPGGSSSGAGAAVSAGLAAGGLGTDTGGSIRQPASYSGIVGLKPTNGLVPMDGIFPMSISCDTVGPMTRTVEDNALLLDGMVAEPGRYAGALGHGGLSGLTIGVPHAWIERDANADVAAAVLAGVEALRDAGAAIVDVALAPGEEDYAAYQGIVFYEAAATHRPLLAEHIEDYGAHVRTRLEGSAAITSADNAAAVAQAQRLTAKMTEGMAGVDVLVLPTQPTTAPAFGQDVVTIKGQVFQMVAVRGRFTIPFNLTGWPGLSVPTGFSPDALPIGMQLVAPANHEHLLFRVGHSYQLATDWHTQRPPVG